MNLAGVQSRQIDWESENLPERWMRFRQHVKRMVRSRRRKVRKVQLFAMVWRTRSRYRQNMERCY